MVSDRLGQGLVAWHIRSRSPGLLPATATGQRNGSRSGQRSHPMPRVENVVPSTTGFDHRDSTRPVYTLSGIYSLDIDWTPMPFPAFWMKSLQPVSLLSLSHPFQSAPMDLSQLGEITDPSDFSLETLKKLDSTFRCTICKEFFEAPVSLTQCGHTFCSLVSFSRKSCIIFI